MRPHDHQRHLTSQQIQELLDRELTPREEASARAHLAACAHCKSEVEAWALLFADLEELPELEPGPVFSEEVLAQAPARRPMPSRVREWLVPQRSPRDDEVHVPAGSIQDYLDGILAPRPAARVKAHLDGCPSCRREVEGWDALMGSLGPLPRLAPGPGFAERVMAQVRVPAPVPTRGQGLAGIPGRILAWVRSYLPDSRNGWAVVGGVASAPTITVAALIYMLFSRPALTPGSLGAYLLWKGSHWFGSLVSIFSTMTAESPFISGILSFLESFTGSPFLLGLGGLGLSLLSAAALWVLYRNLIATPRNERYARARP